MSTRNDKLTITTTSKNGKASPASNKGGLKATILNGKAAGTIEIETDQRTDGKALINISGPDSVVCFSGTFAELYDVLNGRVSANEDSQYVEVGTADTGGGIYNDIIRLKDGKVLVISDDLIGLYESDDAYGNNEGPEGVLRR